jgi:drug/metabolite transporter (DMT)-like permease
MRPRLNSMTSSRPLHFKTNLMILLMVVFGPLGNLLLGKGMKQLGATPAWTLGAIARFVDMVLHSGTVWLGIASLIAFFVFYNLVLSWADYSYVQPASAIAYGTAALLGRVVLGELVSPLQWIGILIICMGVIVVGRTPPRTTEPARVA